MGCGCRHDFVVMTISKHRVGSISIIYLFLALGYRIL